MTPSLCLATSGAAALLVFTVGGCATHAWAPGPGVNPVDFGAAQARCSLFARHSGGGFSASGSRNFVIGAAIGYGLSDAIRANADFNDCMLASGWRIADQQVSSAGGAGGAKLGSASGQPAADSWDAQFQAIDAERKDCIQKARDEPDYAVLRPHFSDLDSGRFTVMQLADDHTPTAAEGQLLGAYSGEIAACTSKQIAAISQLVAPLGPILSQMRSENEATLILLVKQQLTWGKAAQRQQQSLDSAIARADAIRA